MFILVDGKVRYEVDKPVFTGSTGSGEVNYHPVVLINSYATVHIVDFDIEEHYGCLCKYGTNIITPQQSSYEDHEVYTVHMINNHEEAGFFLCPKCELGHEKKFTKKLECACGVILMASIKYVYMWD